MSNQYPIRKALLSVIDTLDDILDEMDEEVLDSSAIVIRDPEVKLAEIDSNLSVLSSLHFADEYRHRVYSPLDELLNIKVHKHLGGSHVVINNFDAKRSITKINTVGTLRKGGAVKECYDMSCKQNFYFPSMYNCKLSSDGFGKPDNVSASSHKFLNFLSPEPPLIYRLDYKLVKYLKKCWVSYISNREVGYLSSGNPNSILDNGYLTYSSKGRIFKEKQGSPISSLLSIPHSITTVLSNTTLQTHIGSDDRKEVFQYDMYPMFDDSILPKEYLSPIPGISIFPVSTLNKIFNMFIDSQTKDCTKYLYQNAFALIVAARLLKKRASSLPVGEMLEVPSDMVLEIADFPPSQITNVNSMGKESFQMIKECVSDTITEFLGKDDDLSFSSFIVHLVERNIVNLAMLCSVYQKRLDNTISICLDSSSVPMFSVPACAVVESVEESTYQALEKGSAINLSVKMSTLCTKFYISADNIFLDYFANNSFQIGLSLGNFHSFIANNQLKQGSGVYAHKRLLESVRHLHRLQANQNDTLKLLDYNSFSKVMSHLIPSKESRSISSTHSKYLLTTPKEMGILKDPSPVYSITALSNLATNENAARHLIKSTYKILSSLATFKNSFN